MWLIVPLTSSPSAEETADSSAVLNSHFQTLERSALSRSKPMSSRSWRNKWKREPWLRFLCGQMPEPSTAARGVDSWIASLRDTRANPSAPLAESLDAQIIATYGPSFAEPLAKYARRWSGLRTSMLISDLGFSKFGEISKDLATALRRDCLARERLARRILGAGSLSWATPRVTTNGGCPTEHSGKGSRLEDQIDRDWITPHGMGNSEESGKVGGIGRVWTASVPDDGCPELGHTYGTGLEGRGDGRPTLGGRKRLEDAVREGPPSNESRAEELRFGPDISARPPGGGLELAHSQCNGRGEGPEDLFGWESIATHGGEGLANAGRFRCNKGTPGGGRQEGSTADNEGEVVPAIAHGPTIPIWPPGPGDLDTWRLILEQHPELAPAIEPALRGVADGVGNRIDRLRLCGNGVVDVCAGLAALTLWARLREW